MLLCIGYPESVPNSIPKLNRNIIAHKEKYKILNDSDIQRAYEEKYGEFNEDTESYFMKAYIEVIEAAKQESDRWLKLTKRRMQKLGIKNHAQFLFNLRYPTEAMVNMNENLIHSFRRAGFNFI